MCLLEPEDREGFVPGLANTSSYKLPAKILIGLQQRTHQRIEEFGVTPFWCISNLRRFPLISLLVCFPDGATRNQSTRAGEPN